MRFTHIDINFDVTYDVVSCIYFKKEYKVSAQLQKVIIYFRNDFFVVEIRL